MANVLVDRTFVALMYDICQIPSIIFFHGFLTFLRIDLVMKLLGGINEDEWNEIMKNLVLCNGNLYCVASFFCDICIEENSFILFTFLPYQGMIIFVSIYELLFLFILFNFISRWLFLLLVTVVWLVCLCSMLMIMSFGV